MICRKKSAKDIMLPHSAAKVEFYEKYLEKYLAIMSVTPRCKRVNVFDVFCGRGEYDDGGLGSPIRAVRTITKITENYPSDTDFHLYLNDLNVHHIENVKEYLDKHMPDHKKNVTIRYSHVDAEGLLDRLCRLLVSTPNDTRNLLFIDPYGYKCIHKDIIERLMDNGKSEILLFLPVSFMHRFTHVAFDEKKAKGTGPLRKFISDYFPEDHPVRKEEPMDISRYIREITKAFSYKCKYYTANYEIQRDAKNYFALFFLSSNILGFEKIINVKWELDAAYGKGFRLNYYGGIFPEFVEEFNKEREEESKKYMRLALIRLLRKGNRNNGQLYEFTLRCGYLPKIANAALKQLLSDNLILIAPIKDAKIRKGAFYLNYKRYKHPIIIISLNKEKL